MRVKPWLIALAIVMASCAGLVGVFGPRLARTAKGLYGPISKMKSEQQDFETWRERRAWKEPAERRPRAPEGVPPEVHELPLDKASEIQALLAPGGSGTAFAR